MVRGQIELGREKEKERGERLIHVFPEEKGLGKETFRQENAGWYQAVQVPENHSKPVK